MNLPKALVAAGFLLIASLLAGGAGAQTLRIGLGDDPDVLDPALSRLFAGGVVIAALCERLVDISPELDIVPRLATEWQWTDGNKGLVIKLRQGVKFHDGEKFDAAAVKAAQVIQAMAGEAGFAIKIRATEMAAYIDLQVKGEFEALMWGWAGKVDPDGNIYNLLSCKAPPAYNTAHYCNPEVDRELDAARLVEAPAERLQHYAKVAEHVLADRPIIYLWHGKFLYAMNPKLTGFTPYPDGVIRLQGVRMQ
jgi:ABC-type transport system substrate-binding protein